MDATLELTDEEILAGIDENEARELALTVPRQETFVRRYPGIPEELECLMWQRADRLARRNLDSELDRSDILSRYVERYFKKLKHFKPEKFTAEQFVGLLCNNIDAELMPRQIKTRQRRHEMLWLDLALDAHGIDFDPDSLFIDEGFSRLARDTLAADVRETIRNIADTELQKIGHQFMRSPSLHALAKARGFKYTTFRDGPWTHFKTAFVDEWGRKAV